MPQGCKTGMHARSTPVITVYLSLTTPSSQSALRQASQSEIRRSRISSMLATHAVLIVDQVMASMRSIDYTSSVPTSSTSDGEVQAEATLYTGSAKRTLVAALERQDVRKQAPEVVPCNDSTASSLSSSVSGKLAALQAARRALVSPDV